MGERSGKPVWREEQGLGIFLAARLPCSISVFSARPLATDAHRWARAKKENQLFKDMVKVRLKERAVRVL
ncbi:MAG TPA: hypothetical protein V6C97_34030 [Oculatellaceae cyanobacterium]